VEPARTSSRRRRRDRHGRGLRGPLIPYTVVLGGRELRIPASQTRGERFDDLVLDAVEELEQRWASELEGVEFAWRTCRRCRRRTRWSTTATW
jgi:hypothetical protein